MTAKEQVMRIRGDAPGWTLRIWDDHGRPRAYFRGPLGQIDAAVWLADGPHRAAEWLTSYKQIGPALGVQLRQFMKIAKREKIPKVRNTYRLQAKCIAQIYSRIIENLVKRELGGRKPTLWKKLEFTSQFIYERAEKVRVEMER